MVYRGIFTEDEHRLKLMYHTAFQLLLKPMEDVSEEACDADGIYVILFRFSVLPTCRPYEYSNVVKFEEFGPWLRLYDDEGASVLAFGDSGLSVLSRCFYGGHKPTGTCEFRMKHFFFLTGMY